MKKPQWVTIVIAFCVTLGLFLFGRTSPKQRISIDSVVHSENDGHIHDNNATSITIDTILLLAKKELSAEQIVRLQTLENSISRGDVKDQQLHVYHRLARFWADSARIFEPYAWYQAEAARLENSEKSLTFAAQLFLDNLQGDQVTARRTWKALQAKDLFERSLKLNPANDSAKVGLGACFIFGGISAAPMEGIGKVLEVVAKDSTNIYAQMTLVRGSLISGQYDKAISRLETIIRLKPRSPDAMVLLGDVYAYQGESAKARIWYEMGLQFIDRDDYKNEVRGRIQELKK